MTEFKCKFCDRPMDVSALAYKSNQYCNQCFDERVKALEEREAAKEAEAFFGMPKWMNYETMRAMTLHYNRTGDKRHMGPIFESQLAQIAMLYPGTMFAFNILPDGSVDVQKCPNCDYAAKHEIGYGNLQCDRCQFVFKAEENEFFGKLDGEKDKIIEALLAARRNFRHPKK